MITKLKYVGVGLEDLLDIYVLFIRIVTEYCAVAFHSSLTIQQSDKIEKIQKTCLKVILSEMYVSYQAALEMCGLETLFNRREKRCIDFSLKSIKNHKPMFCKTQGSFSCKFCQNWRVQNISNTICQRLLNDHCNGKWVMTSTILYAVNDNLIVFRCITVCFGTIKTIIILYWASNPGTG